MWGWVLWHLCRMECLQSRLKAELPCDSGGSRWRPQHMVPCQACPGRPAQNLKASVFIAWGFEQVEGGGYSWKGRDGGNPKPAQRAADERQDPAIANCLIDQCSTFCKLIICKERQHAWAQRVHPWPAATAFMSRNQTDHCLSWDNKKTTHNTFQPFAEHTRRRHDNRFQWPTVISKT